HDFAKDYIPLAGKRTITDQTTISDKDYTFEISGSAFYQVNTNQMTRLYEKAAEYANLTGEEVVFDLYCGIGTIGLTMADKAAMIVGIEEVPGAVLDANRNAVINGIVNARYYTGRAEEILPKLLNPEDKLYADYLTRMDLKDLPRVVILDPPRGGCAPSLLETVTEIDPDRIVYISCDAGTLARDIKVLQTLGYEFQEATPVEMFAWTMHSEVVCSLRKRDE
ncbi:MAG: 23S rRNA (uracil(1939)-C(5))-methyltransferase RlmD, partial [Eubacteriales bacterium]|nr:23S rRNA (uracil(1939)-C(5))-methyltransferase RlmD [Eubacteriales bacterium]